MSSSSSTNEHWRQDVKIDDIPPEGQKLLRDYAGLKQDEILPHIENIVSAVTYIHTHLSPVLLPFHSLLPNFGMS